MASTSKLNQLQLQKAEAEAVAARTEAQAAVRRLFAAGAPDVNTEQAAAYADSTPGTFAVLRSKGGGPQFIPGPRPRYTQAALDAWLALPKKRRSGSPNAGRPPKKAVRR